MSYWQLVPTLRSLWLEAAKRKFRRMTVELDLDQLIEDYYTRIHRAAIVLTGNAWDADDLAQETFLVMSNNLTRFQGRSSIYTYLYGILLNLDRRERRRMGTRRRKLRVLGEEAEQGRERGYAPTGSPLEMDEWKQSLWSLVARLPDGQRHAIVLRFSESMRYEQISEAMSCPLGTVKSRIFHGLLSLRRMAEDSREELQQIPAFPLEDATHAG